MGHLLHHGETIPAGHLKGDLADQFEVIQILLAMIQISQKLKSQSGLWNMIGDPFDERRLTGSSGLLQPLKSAPVALFRAAVV